MTGYSGCIISYYKLQESSGVFIFCIFSSGEWEEEWGAAWWKDGDGLCSQNWTSYKWQNRGNNGSCDSGNQGRVMTLKEKKQTQNPSNWARLTLQKNTLDKSNVGNQVDSARLLSWGDSWTARHIKDSLQAAHSFLMTTQLGSVHVYDKAVCEWAKEPPEDWKQRDLMLTDTWKQISCGLYNTLSKEEAVQKGLDPEVQ